MPERIFDEAAEIIQVAQQIHDRANAPMPDEDDIYAYDSELGDREQDVYPLAMYLAELILCGHPDC